MIVEIKKGTDNVTIETIGRLDATSAPSLENDINEVLKETKNLVLDFKGLEYVSSAGLRVLLGAQKKLQQVGSMKVINVCEDVMDVFEITGFADILTIE